MLSDHEYPGDVPAWKTARQQWRDIMKSNQIEEVPGKPF
jgi:hypothetical protein